MTITLLSPSDSIFDLNEMRIAQDDSKVIITCDADFEEQGWKGTGTSSDPFVIEGLEFSQESGHCISISNTSVHFKIKNCTFENTTQPDEEISSGTDIWLKNVTHSIVEDCQFTGLNHHVFVEDTEDYLFQNCMINGGTLGFSENTKHVSIINNTMWRVGTTIPYGTQELKFSGNNISGRDYFGMIVIENSVVNLTENMFDSSLDLRLYVNEVIMQDNIIIGEFSTNLLGHVSDRLIVRRNEFGSGGFSVSEYENVDDILQNAIISENFVGGKPLRFMNNDDDITVDLSDLSQLIMYRCENVELMGEIHDVPAAMIIEECADLEIREIDVSNCERGIWISDSRRIEIEQLTCRNFYRAVSVIDSRNVSISNSDISEGSLGIYLWLSTATIIEDCYLTDLDYCIKAEYTSLSQIHNNTFDAIRANVLITDAESPTDNWDGNTWSDYHGWGAYIIAFGDGWTIADHTPKAILGISYSSWLAETIILLFLLFILVVSAFIITFDYMGKRRLEDKEFNRWMLSLGATLALFLPSLIITGTSVYGNSYWAVSSPFSALWYDRGNLYSTTSRLIPPLVSAIPADMSILTISVMVLVISWKTKTENHSKYLYYSLFLILVFLLAFGALGYDIFNGETIRLPLPFGTLLIFVLFNRLKPIEKEATPVVRTERVVCTSCGARYSYPEDQVRTGMVFCQNCGQEIEVDNQ